MLAEQTRLHGAGRTTVAVRNLEELAGDLEHLHGPDDATLRSVRDMIARLGG
ncbi:hypothetical protein [Actinomadura sp. CNU-125]|uniref:hypothetical protein n=1 Tax=Actinomadura sp. CNU-125 TaxID=1904961 RepID=UPI0021CCDD13|nr:hypothetical protein [Actinomadura sp. CNU-125]